MVVALVAAVGLCAGIAYCFRVWRLGLLCLCSCGLFPSLEGFSGGELTNDDGGVNLDAGSTADGFPVDAGGGDTGGGDAGADFCAPVAGFTLSICDEFERDPSNLNGAWTDVSAAGTTMTLVPGLGLGDSTGVHIAVDATSTSGVSHGTFSRRVIAAVNHVIFRQSLYISASRSADYQFGGVTFTYGAGLNRVAYFTLSGTSYRVTEQEFTNNAATGNSEHLSAAPVDPGMWHSFTLDVDAVNKRLIVVRNGQTEIDAPLALAFAPASIQLSAGVTYVYSGAAVDDRLDNVRLDVATQ